MDCTSGLENEGGLNERNGAASPGPQNQPEPGGSPGFVLVVKRICAGAIEAEHRTCEHRPHLGISDAVVLVEESADAEAPRWRRLRRAAPRLRRAQSRRRAGARRSASPGRRPPRWSAPLQSPPAMRWESNCGAGRAEGAANFITLASARQLRTRRRLSRCRTDDPPAWVFWSIPGRAFVISSFGTVRVPTIVKCGNKLTRGKRKSLLGGMILCKKCRRIPVGRAAADCFEGLRLFGD